MWIEGTSGWLRTLLLAGPLLFCWNLEAEVLRVECGDVLAGRMFRMDGEIHQFSIEMEAGDVLKLWLQPVGEFLRVKAKIRDFANHEIHDTDGHDKLQIETRILSVSGRYTIYILNRGIGEYDLKIGCTRRDGTEIEPKEDDSATDRPAGDGP